jgi:hypothetical protein
LEGDDTLASVHPQIQLYEIRQNVTFVPYVHDQQFYQGQNQCHGQHDGVGALNRRQV